MERLITPKDVMERYGCSRQTARKYIRQCNPHMERPLAVHESAFREWELRRTVSEPVHRLTLDEFKRLTQGERVIVPRRR